MSQSREIMSKINPLSRLDKLTCKLPRGPHKRQGLLNYNVSLQILKLRKE